MSVRFFVQITNRTEFVIDPRFFVRVEFTSVAVAYLAHDHLNDFEQRHDDAKGTSQRKRVGRFHGTTVLVANKSRPTPRVRAFATLLHRPGDCRNHPTER